VLRVRKKPDSTCPQGEDNEGHGGDQWTSGVTHTRTHGTDGKKFPVESWNYGYGDIGVSFGANRGTALRPAVVTAAKTLKLDDIARSEHIYISPGARVRTRGYTRLR